MRRSNCFVAPSGPEELISIIRNIQLSIQGPPEKTPPPFWIQKQFQLRVRSLGGRGEQVEETSCLKKRDNSIHTRVKCSGKVIKCSGKVIKCSGKVIFPREWSLS